MRPTQLHAISSSTSFFVSDLHGNIERYRKLFARISAEKPRALFFGGDLLPHAMAKTDWPNPNDLDFINGFLIPNFASLRRSLGDQYPAVFLILGNDDPRCEEDSLCGSEALGLWEYMSNRRVIIDSTPIYGYSYCPPSPFQLKDWERYDVSRFVDPGCVSPEDGFRTVPISPDEARYRTIAEDLEELAGQDDVEQAIFLFHSPPYQTTLDRAALDDKMFDHAPLDVHVGSIAIRRFIEQRRPKLTLHGHVHESTRLTGSWRGLIGQTHIFSAANDSPELSLVRFSLGNLEDASRELL